jgi:hypothetical protein
MKKLLILGTLLLSSCSAYRIQGVKTRPNPKHIILQHNENGYIG